MKELGESIVLAAHGKNREEFNKAAGMAEVLDHSDTYKIEVCKMAASIYDQLDEHNMTGNLFRLLSKEASWNSHFDPMVEAVERVLTPIVKQASLGPVMAMGSAGANALPGGILGATGLAALLGVGGGALMHTFSADTQAQDKETEAMMQKIENYRRMREDIERDIAQSGVLETADKKDDQEFVKNYDL